MLKEKLFCYLQYCLPQHSLSRLIAKVANSRIPWLKNTLINYFISRFNVDMSIAESADLQHFPDFNSFFTRKLKPDARPIVPGNNTIASPCDGYISQIGAINNQKIFQAKGRDFDLYELLTNQELAETFQKGAFATLYLSPKDYHRVHMPFSGNLEKMIYVPGKLFSVNPCSVTHISRLFSRNERVITLFDTQIGPMAVILVGAMLVSGIETVWAGEITPQKNHAIRQWSYSDKELSLSKGDELGTFKFGSTVIILFSERSVKWDENISANQEIKMGQLIGYINGNHV